MIPSDQAPAHLIFRAVSERDSAGLGRNESQRRAVCGPLQDQPWKDTVKHDLDLRTQAARCRRQAVNFRGRPERAFLLRAADEFERLAAIRPERDRDRDSGKGKPGAE